MSAHDCGPVKVYRITVAQTPTRRGARVVATTDAGEVEMFIGGRVKAKQIAVRFHRETGAPLYNVKASGTLVLWMAKVDDKAVKSETERALFNLRGALSILSQPVQTSATEFDVPAVKILRSDCALARNWINRAVASVEGIALTNAEREKRTRRLLETIASLNPDHPGIGLGMLATITSEAKALLGEGDR